MCELGHLFGYFPNAGKSWLVVKQEHLSKAEKLFADLGDFKSLRRVRSGYGKSGKSMEFVSISRPGKSMEICEKLWKLQKKGLELFAFYLRKILKTESVPPARKLLPRV